MDHRKVAEGVLKGVGGEENVTSLVHCATRLRFVLKDKSKADPAAVKAVPGIITTAEAGGQFQVVVGNEVPEVFAEIGKISKLGTGEDKAAADAPKQNLFNRFVSMIAAIFTPLLWVLAGTGLLKAFLVASATFGWIDTESTTYVILYALSDGFINFLPMALAITAAKYFKASEFTSFAIAAALVYPTIVSLNGTDGITFFAIPVTMVSYVSSVIPIIIIVWLQSYAEKFLYAKLHSSVRRFLTPMIIVAIAVPLVLIAIGPLSSFISSGLANGVNWVFENAPWAGGAIMGGMWQVFVIFGLHWGFVPIIVLQYQELGYLPIAAPLWAAVLGMAAATAGVWVRTRNKNLKSLAAPATLSGFLAGITEPAIYGVTLPLKRPFAFAVAGGAVGGAIIAMGGVASNNPGALPSLLSLPSLIGYGNVWFMIVGVAVAIVLPFVLTLVFGFKDPVEDATVHAVGKDLDVRSPLDGKVVPLAEVPDVAFAEGALGDGVAIVPTGGVLYAPFDAVVAAAFPTGHAIGLRSADGAEVLIHLGIDTVKLAGEHFTLKVEQGQTVAAGDVLVEFDLEAIKAAGYDMTTPIIVTNGDQHEIIGDRAAGAITHGEALYFATTVVPAVTGSIKI